MFSRRNLLVLTALGTLAVGCGSATPSVKVLGVSQAATQAGASAAAPAGERMLVVFVEVVNPTQRDLHLSRMEYRMAALPWLEAKGKVALSREVPSDSTAVVEIPVPYSEVNPNGQSPGAVPFQLKARLFSVERRVERSWRVAVSGTIDLATMAASGVAVRARIATAK